ncbi:MAG: hypothetical protein JXB62_15785 [Pirellulales bacterium]|nr:hypothetical protein [Pirellulales bacterium]
MSPPQRLFGRPGQALCALLPIYALIDILGPAVLLHLPGADWAVGALWYGTLFGQVAFLAIWAALGPFRVWVRWPLVLAVSFGLYFCICFGAAVFSPYYEYEYTMVVGMVRTSLLIPVLFLTVQFPLWIRRTLGGWQIVPADQLQLHSATEARQFGLRHILGLTAIFAVSLSLVRLSIADWGLSDRPVGQTTDPQIWLALAMYSAVACLYSAAWTLPAAWACFLASDRAKGSLVMMGIWLGVSLLLIMVVAVISAVAGNAGVPGELAGMIVLQSGALVAVLMGSLHLLRASGCVMTRTARPKKADVRPPAVADDVPPSAP